MTKFLKAALFFGSLFITQVPLVLAQDNNKSVADMLGIERYEAPQYTELSKAIRARCVNQVISRATSFAATTNTGHSFKFELDDQGKPKSFTSNGEVAMALFDVNDPSKIAEIHSSDGQAHFLSHVKRDKQILRAAAIKLHAYVQAQCAKASPEYQNSKTGQIASAKSLGSDDLIITPDQVDMYESSDFWTEYFDYSNEFDLTNLFAYDWANKPKCDVARRSCTEVCDSGFDLGLIGCGAIGVAAAFVTAGIGGVAGVACGIGAYVARGSCRQRCEFVPCSP